MQSAVRPSAVLFDFDGTLVQTRVSSWEVFRGVSQQFDLGIDHPDAFFDLCRDNLFESLRRLCGSEERAEEVKTEFYNRLEADYAPNLVPGITSVIQALTPHCPLSVVSSNSMSVIRRILTGANLGYCFSHVFGGDVIESKKDAIHQLLGDAATGFGRHCQGSYAEDTAPRQVDPASTVLVGDTAGDMAEARAAGIRAVGVSWGMHSAEELIAAGAEFVALWPEELISHLLGDAAALPAGCPMTCGCDGDCASCAGTCSTCTTVSCAPPLPERPVSATRLARRRAAVTKISVPEPPSRPRVGRRPTALTPARGHAGAIHGAESSTDQEMLTALRAALS